MTWNELSDALTVRDRRILHKLLAACVGYRMEVAQVLAQLSVTGWVNRGGMEGHLEAAIDRYLDIARREGDISDLLPR